MGVSVRPATVEDLLAMQRCNLLCLPENYQLKVSGPVVPARTRNSHATLLHAWDYKLCLHGIINLAMKHATPSR